MPVYAILDALGWPTIRNSAILTSLSLARSLGELVLLVAIVVLYLELRNGEKAKSTGTCHCITTTVARRETDEHA